MSELIQLFIAFFKIGLFTIGGGVASLPLIEVLIVNEKQWLSFEQFSHLVVISEMTPGPIAVNASTFVGNMHNGFLGGVVATLGVVLPSFIIVIMLAKIYYKYRELNVVNAVLNGLRPTVVGLIFFATVSITLVALFETKDIFSEALNFNVLKIFLLLFYLFLLKRFKVNPILIIILSGVVGLLVL